jgi:formylglycine-generating enzyme required for sulfatase activity
LFSPFFAESAEKVPVPELVHIPGEKCTIGAPNGIKKDLLPYRHAPPRNVHLDPYDIGRYEVTNLQYAAFIQDGGYESQSYWSDEGWAARERFGWQYPQVWLDRRYVPGDRNQHPVVGVSWYEARAYCRWLSAKTGFHFDLPTEDQWEYAARGPQAFLWPWGNTWDLQRCNYGDDTDGDRQGDGGIDGYRYTAPMGTYPTGASPFGCLDMAGNAEEWCLDRYHEEGRERVYRVLRGGSWMTVSPRNLTAVYRGGTEPWVRFVFWGTIGFRVVRLPDGSRESSFREGESN